MTLKEYQNKAMNTCMGSCANIAYMLTGLSAEVGEVNDKVAKAIRKGYLSLHRNDIAWWGHQQDHEILREDLKKEIGDVLWFVAGISQTLCISLEDVATANLAKLADRAQRNVIDGNGDNR